MPQIQINGELREVSQAEYDALTTNGQASTPAAGSYEQYATTIAKEQAVKQLAAGDAALGETTNVSPEFQQELSNIRTSADAAAGDNKDAYAARYAQEQQSLYTNAPYSREALKEELSAPPPTTQPGTVGVAVPAQQGTDGQVIGTLNTNIPGLSEPTGSIVSSPVKGLADGGLTTGSPAAGIESQPTYPTEDPQIPAPSTEGAGDFQRPPPPPDAAFLAEQAQQENRWTQAAATNPEGIDSRGSVVIDRGDGSRETINRDGSYEISNADGTFRYDATGQETSYTSPTVGGYSVTTTSDGVQYTNYTNGPLTQSTITKDGEPISTTVSYDAGYAQFTSTQTGDAPAVNSATVPLGDGQIATVTEFEGELTTNTTTLTSKRVASEAEQQAIAENEKLREDLIAAKEKTLAGQELTASETQALEQQAEAAAQADAELAQAELALANEDPTLVPPGEDPQVDTYTEVDDPLPSLDTTEVEPEPVSPAQDPEVADANNESVPLADVEEQPPEISAFEDPEVPAEPDTVSDADTQPGDELVVDDPQAPADIETFSADLVETDPLPLTEEEIAEYRARTAVDPGEVGARFQEPFVSDDAAAAEAAYFQENPEEIRAVIDAPAPPEVESTSEELELSLEELEERAEAQEALNDDVAEYLDEVEDERAEEYDDQVDNYEEYLDDQEDLQDELAEEQEEFVDAYEEYLDEVEDERAEEYDDQVDNYEEYLDDQEDLQDELAEEQDDQVDNYEEYLDDQEDLQDELAEEQDDGISPYGEEDDLFDPDAVPLDDIRTNPEDVTDTGGVPTETLADLQTDPGLLPDQVAAQEATARSAVTQAAKVRAQAQATLAAQRKQANDGDWRVKLRLAPAADYLYRAAQPGILQPLAVTDGVVFPYTPQITTAYKASYNAYDLTHSNYRGYFYQGSQVEDIQINAVFTAQDSKEAEYLLAVIHFFRSATKMFYGQDAQRGAPPPLVFLQGFGEYQFNLNPCVITQFNYVLPADVDYIRAGSPNINGTNLLQKRDRQDLPTNPFSSAWTRLKNAGIKKGAIPTPPAPPTLGTNRPTYVPTKIDISVVLHPIQSREQVSKQFSVKQYANGDLLKGGFW